MNYFWMIESFAPLLVAVFTLLYMWNERKKWNAYHKQQMAELQKSAIQAMDYQRHDWMNDLQVFYGYLKLNKYDKLEQCVENIKERMNQDSMITKLGIPSLILFLLSFRAQTNHPFMLKVEIDHEINLVQRLSNPVIVQETIIDLIQYYEAAAIPADGELNELLIHLEIGEKQLNLDFIYAGNMAGADSWIAMKQKLVKLKSKMELDYDDKNDVEDTDEMRIWFPLSNNKPWANE